MMMNYPMGLSLMLSKSVFVLHVIIVSCFRHIRLLYVLRLFSSEILSRSSIESTSDLDSSVSRPETRTINKEFRQSIQTNSSSLISMKTERKIRSNPSSVSYTITTTEEHRRAATVTKFRQSDEENDDDDEKT